MIRSTGYYAARDGGGGDFIWTAASSATPDGGSIFQASAGGIGRWLRIIEHDITPEMFGAKCDGTWPDDVAIAAAVAALPAGSALTFNPKTYTMKARVTLTKIGLVLRGKNTTIKIDPAFVLNGTDIVPFWIDAKRDGYHV